MSIRINFPADASAHHPALRAWRAAVDKANADLARAMGWHLQVNFTEMTFTPAARSTVVSMLAFRRTHDFLRPLVGPQGDGPRAA